MIDAMNIESFELELIYVFKAIKDKTEIVVFIVGNKIFLLKL